MCGFSAKHAALRRNSNSSGWSRRKRTSSSFQAVIFVSSFV